MQMQRMIVNRLLIGLVTLWVVSVLVFVMTAALPGDVAQIVLGQSATEETLKAFREARGLDKSLFFQYFDWLGNMLSGDLGTSKAGGASISSLIGERLANTLELAGIVALISVPLSVVLGLLGAMYPGTWIDRTLTSGTLMLVAVPDFFIATFLVLVLAVQFNLFSAVADVSVTDSFGTLVNKLAIPVAVLVIVVAAQMIRMTRAGILNIMNSPYIEMAILKGVRRKRIILRHAFFNTIGPIANVVALNLAYLVSGVVIVETIFAYPGLAKLMIDGVQIRDLPLVQTTAMIFCATYVVLIIFADVVAILSNPRLRHPK